MNGDKISELLSRDVGEIPVPDMWDGVRQRTAQLPTVREKHYTRRIRPSSLIYVLVGGCAVSVVLFLIIAAAGLPKLSEYSGQLTGYTPAGESLDSTGLPMVSAKAGSLALSERSIQELETLVGSIGDKESVYEDSAYIYHFDSSGRLVSMLDENSGAEINLEKTALLLLQRHFPDISIENYSIFISDDGDRPSLYARADVLGEGLTITEIKMTFYTDEWQTLLGVGEDQE